MNRTLLDKDTLAVAAEANFLVHAGWVQQQLPGMQTVTAADLVIVDSGLTCDTFNIVGGARLAAATARSRIEATIDYFRGVQRPFAWWVGPADQPEQLRDLLLEAGLEHAEDEIAMAIDLDRLPPAKPLTAALTIERVGSADQLADFAEVVAANWEPADPRVVEFYRRASALLLTPAAPLWFYVGYHNSQPVATAELTVGGGVVGLYNVCTLTAYRRRGYGSAMTLWPLLEARRAGQQTGILQAAAAGVSIYRRTGFESIGRLSEYKPPAG